MLFPLYGIRRKTAIGEQKEKMQKNAEGGLCPIWRGHNGGPQSENLARLMISMLSEQLRSCHFLKKRYGNQNKEMRQESK